MEKRSRWILRFSMVIFAATILIVATLALSSTAFAASLEPDHGSQKQDITHLKLSPQQTVLIEAIKIASNQNVGYSFEHANLNPDVICYTFVNHALLDSNAKGISKEFEAALLKEDPEGVLGLVDMKTQTKALEAIGYVRHDFVGFDDPYLIEGSVMYDCFRTGSFAHAELYLGRYDLDRLDKNGNPIKDEKGTPMTIGARIDDNDPAAGDQLQTKEKCWLGGEVGAFKGNSRGDDYWDFYYAPENLGQSA